MNKEKTPSTQVIYRDIDPWFAAHPMTGDVTAITNETAIKKAVQNLVLMNFGEVPFEPNVGSNVTSLLFAAPNDITAITINNYIREVLLNFEPRIQLLDVKTVFDLDKNMFETTIVFGFLNKIINTTFNLDLRRVR